MGKKNSTKHTQSMAKSMKKSMGKAKRVSNIAKGKRGKSSVFRGTKAKTAGGLKKSDLVRNKRGKVVSRKQAEAGKKAFAKRGLPYWRKNGAGTGITEESAELGQVELMAHHSL